MLTNGGRLVDYNTTLLCWAARTVAEQCLKEHAGHRERTYISLWIIIFNPPAP